MTSKAEAVSQAKLAEQAERYDGEVSVEIYYIDVNRVTLSLSSS